MGHGYARLGALPQGLAPDGFQFDRFVGQIVEKTGRLVSTHLSGAQNLLGRMIGILAEAEHSGSGHDFLHQVLSFLKEFGISQNFGGIDGTCRDGETVKRNIPDKLVPTGRTDGGRDGAANPGFFKKGRQRVGPRCVAAGEIRETNVSAGHIAGDTRRRAKDADVADPAEDPFPAGDGGEEILVAQSVLQGADEGVGAKERRKECAEGFIGGGFDGDHHQIHDADLLGPFESSNGLQLKIPVRALNLEAMLTQVVKVAPGQK